MFHLRPLTRWCGTGECRDQSSWAGAAKHGMFTPWMMPSIICPPTVAMLPTRHGAIAMVRKTPWFVEQWRDRHGKLRVYFRKDKGARIPLPSTIGSDEFIEAYQA